MNADVQALKMLMFRPSIGNMVGQHPEDVTRRMFEELLG
jgi:hypothetical protein